MSGLVAIISVYSYCIFFDDYNCFLLGLMYSWGLADKGCLGLGNKTEVPTPERVKETADNTLFYNIMDIACGISHCLAITYTYQLFTWGDGLNGKLGHGKTNNYNKPKSLTISGSDFKVLYISAGYSHSAAITTDHELYTWGDGAYGKLGHGCVANELVPRHVDDLKLLKILRVSCSAFHTLCCTIKGETYAFGGGQYGKLGIDVDEMQDRSSPKLIDALEDIKIVELAAGPYHSLAKDDKGNIYAWGNNRSGRLGIRSVVEIVPLPEKVPMEASGPTTKEDEKLLQERNMETIHNLGYNSFDQLLKRVVKANVIETVLVSVRLFLLFILRLMPIIFDSVEKILPRS